jgi:hypothetical protein
MTKHIKRHHKEVSLEKSLSKNQGAVNQQIKELYRHAQGLGNIEEFDLEVLEACLNPMVLTEALITLIVVRNLSYNIVEWPEFHTLCQVLNKACEGIIPKSHSRASNKVKEAWIWHKDIVQRVVQSAISRIHISLDIYTSPNRFLLLAIYAHFTSYEFKRQKALLALKKVPSHSGDD